MKTHSLTQGSAEWLAYRAQHFNASDAPAMLGCSPYKTRAALLREMHTGLAADVDAGTQRMFDAGHRFEALARPLAEKIIGEDLYPVTGSSGRMSASFDGLTLGEDVVFEHKSANAELRAILAGADAAQALPLHYLIQMEQQLMVSGAGRALFMATLWDGETCTFAAHCWYEPDAELRADILRGWAQFDIDLAAYSPPASAPAAPVGKAPDTLPALRIEVTGAVTASNLAEFKATALAAIRSVNRDLRTDANFADADKAVKWCADVEAKLKAAKEHALSQTASIDELFKALDDIAAESKAVRLDLAKVIDRRKTEVKEQAVLAARRALDLHIEVANAELAPMRLLPVAADFPGAIKGLRSIDSMQDALDTALAGAKIAADGQARGIRANIAAFAKTADNLQFLFADLGHLVHKAGDDFAAVLDARIAKHRADEAAREAKRQADEAARIAAAVAAEAQRIADAERIADAQRIADAEKLAREEKAARLALDARNDAIARRLEADVAAEVARAGAPAALLSKPEISAATDKTSLCVAPQRADDPATLTLGAICTRLGFTVNGAFVAFVLHIMPAGDDGRAQLYTEGQYQAICRQLLAHVGAMAKLYSGNGVILNPCLTP